MRWLGVGLASALAVVTIALAVTGRLDLYINPDSTWFAVGMSIVLLAGSAASFALPLGSEADHGHDHGHNHESEVRSSARIPDASSHGIRNHRRSPRIRAGTARVATVAGGVVASGVVILTLVFPPAALSAELAMSRSTGAPPLFAGSDTITLAATGDTKSFGVGDWATVFATATNPDAFDGDKVELTGFVTPARGHGGLDLTRLVITHCVIDAQPASVPVTAAGPVPATGQWVTVTGTVRATTDGRLTIDAASVRRIPQPKDPYEY